MVRLGGGERERENGIKEITGYGPFLVPFVLALCVAPPAVLEIYFNMLALLSVC